MQEFKNRYTQYPNRKLLEVVEVTRNESGEINSIIADEVRSNGEVYEEGTSITKDELVKTIKDLINIYHFTSAQKVEYDVNNLTIASVAKKDFMLPLLGYADSTITWEVESGEGITINNNMAVVTRTLVQQTVTLKATISNGQSSATKTFNVVIPVREKTESEKLEEDKEKLTLMETELTTDLVLPSRGVNGSHITWTYISSGKTGYVYLVGNKLLSVTRDYVDYYVILKATLENTLGEKVTKDIQVTIKRLLPTITPTSINLDWNQEIGVLNTETKCIQTDDPVNMYIEVSNDYENYFETQVSQNGTKQVNITISEKTALNQIICSGALSFNLEIKIFSDSLKTDYLDSVICTITYNFSSTTPND